MNDYNIILYLYICDTLYVLVVIRRISRRKRRRRRRCSSLGVCDGGQSWS